MKWYVRWREEEEPEVQFDVWATDQQRLGLKPILRRIWALRGKTPLAPVKPRYEWFYLYGFCNPQWGKSFWLLLPYTNVETMNRALRAFARHVRPSRTKKIILVLDRAGWHTSPKLKLPKGIELVHLPPKSPELDPTERLWDLANQGLANEAPDDLDEMMRQLAPRCCWVMTQTDTVRRLTLFYWWPRAKTRNTRHS